MSDNCISGYMTEESNYKAHRFTSQRASSAYQLGPRKINYPGRMYWSSSVESTSEVRWRRFPLEIKLDDLLLLVMSECAPMSSRYGNNLHYLLRYLLILWFLDFYFLLARNNFSFNLVDSHVVNMDIQLFILISTPGS